MENQRDDERTMGGSGGRLGEQLRSGRLAIGTGAVWIVRALRSPQKRGRRLALGVFALGVGLLQRRARREDREILSSSEYTEKATQTAKEVKEGVEEETGMTEVELGESAEEPPEDMQSDMEASGEMTDDEEDFGLDEDTGTDFGDETEEIGTDETAVDADVNEEDEEETEE